jgi:glycolate oxidase FAD binding subunit
VKVLPVAYREATLRFEMSEADAIRTLNEWGGQPLPVSASCWIDGVLALRLSGARAAVEAAVRTLSVAHGGHLMPDCAGFWAGLREQRHAFFDGGRTRPVAAVGAVDRRRHRAGRPAADRVGRRPALAARGRRRRHRPAHPRRRQRGCGGHATLFRGGDNASACSSRWRPRWRKSTNA